MCSASSCLPCRFAYFTKLASCYRHPLCASASRKKRQQAKNAVRKKCAAKTNCPASHSECFWKQSAPAHRRRPFPHFNFGPELPALAQHRQFNVCSRLFRRNRVQKTDGIGDDLILPRSEERRVGTEQ